MTSDEQLYTLTEPLPHRHLMELWNLAQYMAKQLPSDPFADDSGIAVTISASQAKEVIYAMLDIVQITDPQFVTFNKKNTRFGAASV